MDGGSGMKAYNGNINITDGEIYAEAKGSSTTDNNFGIMANRNIIINGGQVSAKGSHEGIRLMGGGYLSQLEKSDRLCQYKQLVDKRYS